MSIKTLTFALEQDALEPQQQLALIMIADKCSEYFTIEQAVEMIWRHTSISEPAARPIVQSLIGELIHLTRYKRVEDMSDHYIIYGNIDHE